MMNPFRRQPRQEQSQQTTDIVYSPHATKDSFDVEMARGVREMEDFLIEMNQMTEADRMKIPVEKEPPERLEPGFRIPYGLPGVELTEIGELE